MCTHYRFFKCTVIAPSLHVLFQEYLKNCWPWLSSWRFQHPFRRQERVRPLFGALPEFWHRIQSCEVVCQPKCLTRPHRWSELTLSALKHQPRGAECLRARQNSQDLANGIFNALLITGSSRVKKYWSKFHDWASPTLIVRNSIIRSRMRGIDTRINPRISVWWRQDWLVKICVGVIDQRDTTRFRKASTFHRE